MINRQQALEIIEKFDFFQGQRAGRELWADKPREVQEDDLIYFQVDCELLKEFIESQPERPKGRWIEGRMFANREEPHHEKVNSFLYCSNCENEAYWDSDYGQQTFDFCPNCGADMRGEEE